MLVEDFTVEVYAYVGLHVLGTVVEYLVGVESLGHGPGADDVVHDPLAQGLGHLVEFHELPHVV